MLRNGFGLVNTVEPIASKGEHEGREITVALDAPEALMSVGHGEADPTADHGSAAPALDVARDLADGADEVLDAVGRREASAKRRRKIELDDGQSLLESFLQTRAADSSPLDSSH